MNTVLLTQLLHYCVAFVFGVVFCPGSSVLLLKTIGGPNTDSYRHSGYNNIVHVVKFEYYGSKQIKRRNTDRGFANSIRSVL